MVYLMQRPTWSGWTWSPGGAASTWRCWPSSSAARRPCRSSTSPHPWTRTPPVKRRKITTWTFGYSNACRFGLSKKRGHLTTQEAALVDHHGISKIVRVGAKELALQSIGLSNILTIFLRHICCLAISRLLMTLFPPRWRKVLNCQSCYS